MLRSPLPLYCWPGVTATHRTMHSYSLLHSYCYSVISVANAAMLLYVGLVYRLEINGLDGDCTYQFNFVACQLLIHRISSLDFLLHADCGMATPFSSFTASTGASQFNEIAWILICAACSNTTCWVPPASRITHWWPTLLPIRCSCAWNLQSLLHCGIAWFDWACPHSVSRLRAACPHHRGCQQLGQRLWPEK